MKSLEESRHMIVKNLLHQKQNENYINAITKLKGEYAVEIK